MPLFVENEWKTTRISAAEGSGVAKAIKAFNAAWPAKLSEIDGQDAIAAAAAITGFQTALKTASKKCDAAKTAKGIDKKKLEDTTKLIDSWSKTLATSKVMLDAAVQKAQQALGAELTHKRIIAAVAKSYEDGLGHGLTETDADLDKLENAIGAGDMTLSYKLQTALSKKLRIMPAELTTKGVKEKIGYACTLLKCKSDGLAPKDCIPAKWQGWKTKLKAATSRFEALEERLDGLENTAAAPDPDQASGSPQYKKDLKQIIADYTAVSAVCTATLATVKDVSVRCKKLDATYPTLSADKKPAAETVARALRKHLDEAEATMKTEVERIRNGSGDLVMKKRNMKLSEADEAKFLAPVLNKMFSKNLRALKSIADDRLLLDELVET